MSASNVLVTNVLVTRDLEPGGGAEVKTGSTIKVHFTSMTWSDRKEVDSSFGGDVYEVRNLGSGNMIKGWEEGLLGLKENGRRLLIVPPGKAYGTDGQGPIKPDETLVFVVDAVTVN